MTRRFVLLGSAACLAAALLLFGLLRLDLGSRVAQRRVMSDGDTGCCELILELPQTVQEGQTCPFRVRIRNGGASTVSLVVPGDGSAWGMRTPVIGWSVLPADVVASHPDRPEPLGFRFCGNINGLHAGEVFELTPNQERELKAWIHPPEFPASGRYRVVFYYRNDPHHLWNGALTDPPALEWDRVRSSTQVTLASNEEIIEVTAREGTASQTPLPEFAGPASPLP